MATPRQLVQQFAENVAAQTDAIGRGDARTGNKYARKYILAFRKLRAYGDEGRAALLPLLVHPRADVRVAAAACLLRYRTKEAVQALEAESRGAGLAAFEAGQALQRWREGTWSLDPS